eukprot:scaffold1941_cov377-Prasinococcus_capsulatus_cf.AAC.12
MEFTATPDFEEAESFIGQVARELKCPVPCCADSLELMEDPHSLPCNHNFCKKCIEEALRVRKAQGQQCPLCKLPTWSRQLTKNQQLQNLVDLVRTHRAQQHKMRSTAVGVGPASFGPFTTPREKQPLSAVGSQEEAGVNCLLEHAPDSQEESDDEDVPMTQLEEEVQALEAEIAALGEPLEDEKGFQATVRGVEEVEDSQSQDAAGEEEGAMIDGLVVVDSQPTQHKPSHSNAESGQPHASSRSRAALGKGKKRVSFNIPQHGLAEDKENPWEAGVSSSGTIKRRREQTSTSLSSRGKQLKLPGAPATSRVLKPKRMNENLGHTKEPKSTPPTAKLVLCPCKLSSGDGNEMSLVAKKLGGKVSKTWNSSVTHIICGADLDKCPEVPCKVLHGMVAGQWILPYDWVVVSLANGSWVDPSAFTLDKAVAQPTARVASGRRCPESIWRLWYALCLTVSPFKRLTLSTTIGAQARNAGGYVLNVAERKRVAAQADSHEFDNLIVVMGARSSAKDRAAAREKYSRKPTSLKWVTDCIRDCEAKCVDLHVLE